MNEHNGNRRLIIMVITLVTTILVATAGWTFGIIKGQAEKDLIRLEFKMDQISTLLQNILITQGIVTNDIEYLKRDLEQYQIEITQLHRKMNLFFGNAPLPD